MELPPDSAPRSGYKKIVIRSHYISGSQVEVLMTDDGDIYACDHGSTNPTFMAMEPKKHYKLPRDFWLHVVDCAHIRGQPRSFELIPDVGGCKNPADLLRFVRDTLGHFAINVQIVPTQEYKNPKPNQPIESIPLSSGDSYLVVTWDASRTRSGEVTRWLYDCVSLFNARASAGPRKVHSQAPWVFGGRSAARRRVREMAERFAPFPLTVLLQGPSGTGKGVLSQDIHLHSHVAKGPFTVVNLAELPKEVMESELFGSVKGAFTHAKDKEGLIEQADGGTLFLDEIGELPLEMQKKLLHVLEKHEVRPVGATAYRKVNIRIIAATLRDLSEMVKAGTFREDLYFRIAQIVIRLPAPEASDFMALTPILLKKVGAELYGSAGSELEEDEITRLCQLAAGFGRRGGMRELENVLKRYLVFRQPELSVEQTWEVALQNGSEPLVLAPPRAEPRPIAERETPIGELPAGEREKDRLRYVSSLVSTMLFLQEVRRAVQSGSSRGLQQELASALGMTPTAVSSRFKGWEWPLVPQQAQVESKLAEVGGKLKPYAAELRRMLDELES